ncbi:MAG: polysaccharide pyruvyl transferase family protein [Pontibacterium sp.]
MRYYLIGAFDRHNYGDILFPLVHSQFIKEQRGEEAQIEYVAITAADLRDCGGFTTTALKSVLKSTLSSEDKVILCGGDILSADWLLMVAHISSPLLMKPARVLRRLLGIKTTNDLVRNLLGEVSTYPYVVGGLDTAADVYYTAVGGAGFNADNPAHLQSVAEKLSTAASVSVRDHEIAALLTSSGIDNRVVPDTALIMSDYYTPDRLKGRDWQQSVQVSGDFNFENYYSVQGAKRLIDGHVEALAAQFKTIYEKTGMAPLMVPIGRAPDHEDHIPLQKIYRRLAESGVPCAYLDSEHVLDIMACLAFARSYIGTSLHGAITTYAFGHKPCALFAPEVKKLSDFIQTWLKPGDAALFETQDFADQFIELLADGGEIADQAGLKANKLAVRQELERYLS